MANSRDVGKTPLKSVASVDDPDMRVVHKLEELLGQALTGELRAIATVTVTVTRGRQVTTGWIGADSGHVHTLISGAALLAHRICKDHIDQ